MKTNSILSFCLNIFVNIASMETVVKSRSYEQLCSIRLSTESTIYAIYLAPSVIYYDNLDYEI